MIRASSCGRAPGSYPGGTRFEAEARDQKGIVVQRQDTGLLPPLSGFKSLRSHQQIGSSARLEHPSYTRRAAGSNPARSTRHWAVVQRLESRSDTARMDVRFVPAQPNGGRVAQLVERGSYKAEVVGSIPTSSTSTAGSLSRPVGLISPPYPERNRAPQPSVRTARSPRVRGDGRLERQPGDGSGSIPKCFRRPKVRTPGFQSGNGGSSPPGNTKPLSSNWKDATLRML